MEEKKLTKQDILNYNEKVSAWKPSECHRDYWIHYFNPKTLLEEKEASREFIGKWCIFGKASVLDKVWKKLYKIALEDDVMSMKIRSGKQNYHQLAISGLIDNWKEEEKKDKKRVICIYVRDYRNKESVFNVRDLIRSIGVKTIIKFKTDQATVDGIYSGDEKEFLYTDRKENA